MSILINKSIELIAYELKTDGFSVLSPSNHKFNELFSIKEKFSKEENEKLRKPYKPKIFQAKDLIQPENKDLAKYNEFCQELIKMLGFGELKLNAIFKTFDNAESEHIAQKPHLDRLPTLKFMLYANDLSFETGAFCLSPGSHHWTKETFKDIKKQSDLEYFDDTRDIPKPILERLIPIEGKSGTIIIFDTNCVHHQGIVKSGEAWIIRAHYRTKIVENHSKGNFLKKLIKKYLNKKN